MVLIKTVKAILLFKKEEIMGIMEKMEITGEILMEKVKVEIIQKQEIQKKLAKILVKIIILNEKEVLKKGKREMRMSAMKGKILQFHTIQI